MAAGAQSTEDPVIKLGDINVGTIEDVRIDEDGEGFRIRIHVTAMFPSFAENLDTILKKKGNMGGCQQRFFWRGNTALRGGGDELNLKSRIGYEAWTCPRPIRLPFGGTIPLPRVRVFGDARNAQWTMFVKPAPLDQIYLSARINDVVGWPNWVEKLFGVHITENVPIGLPKTCGSCSCEELVFDLRPRLDNAQYTVGDDGKLRMAVVLSVNDDVLHKVLACKL